MAARSATLVPSMAQRLERSQAVMSKHQLFSALGGNGRIIVNGVPVILQSIMRESGGGTSFILSVYGPDNQTYRTYTRAA